jgi:hypothetical protein
MLVFFSLYLCHLSVNVWYWGSCCMKPPDTVLIKLHYQLQLLYFIYLKQNCMHKFCSLNAGSCELWQLQTCFCVSCVFGHVNTNHCGVALALERFSDATLCKGYLCVLGTVLWDATYKVTGHGQAKSVSHHKSVLDNGIHIYV